MQTEKKTNVTTIGIGCMVVAFQSLGGWSVTCTRLGDQDTIEVHALHAPHAVLFYGTL